MIKDFSQNSIIIKSMAQSKMRKRLDYIFHKRSYRDGKLACDKMFLVISKVKSKTTER